MCVGVANGSSAKLFVNGHLSAAVGFSDTHTENPIKKKRETPGQRERESDREGNRKSEGFMTAVSHPRALDCTANAIPVPVFGARALSTNMCLVND